MKTEDLIDLLVTDPPPRWRLRSVLAISVVGAVLAAAAVFFATVGVRPDLAEATESGRFLFKFVVTIALAIAAVAAALEVARPDGRLAHRGLALAVAPALAACAATGELMLLPESEWIPRLVGSNARVCLTVIPLLSAGPLVCLMAALRYGAPSNPGQAGLVAGLAASAIAATFYAANCTDDSPLFVLTWYPVAILIVSAAGYLAGRLLLRW